MSRRTWLVATALTIVGAMVATACDPSANRARKSPAATTTTTAPPYSVTPTRTISVHPALVTIGPNGRTSAAVGAVTVGVRPSVDRQLHVVFHETSVGGTAAQWQAAGWNAIAVATLVTGAPLAGREFDFGVTGRIDGVSAGALMTVAVIALIRGDAVDNGITMTGAIDPDGSIEPVSGVADKVSAAAAVHDTRMLIPTGERNATDDSGHSDDVVATGRARGVEVSGVSSIYDAYEVFTGKTLPQLPASTNTRLDTRAYARIHDGVDAWLAKFAASTHDFLGLAPEVQQDFGSYAATAARDAEAAKTLSSEGSEAGAFRAAVSASALMNAIAQTGRLLPVLLTQGPQLFVARVKGDLSTDARIRRLVGSLAADEPRSVTEADALVSAYRDALDASALESFAAEQFGGAGSSGSPSVNDVAEGAVYSFVAGSLVDAASDALAAGRGDAGGAIGSTASASDAALLFRGAAEANLDAFQSLVLVPRSTPAKESLAAAERAFAGTDLDYALAQQGAKLVSALPPYFGSGAATGYAELAGSIALYGRTAELLTRYDGLGHFDPKTQLLAGIGNATAFDAVIGLAESELAAGIGSLRSKGVNPASVAADNELANADRDGDASDRFDALGEYWDGYLTSRALSYLGGFSGP